MQCSSKSEMPNILYSNNSKQVSRFQRKSKLITDFATSKTDTLDVPFESQYEKNTSEYLLDLCNAVYTDELMKQISGFPKWKLSIHALFALGFKNFVSSWYGGKIATKDTDLLVHSFNLLEQAIGETQFLQVDWEQLLCEDVPLLIENNITIMKRVIREDLTLEEFYKLHLYNHTYPMSITDLIVAKLENRSSVQTAFLRGLVEDLLLDKVVEKVTEPYILLEIIKASCEAYLSKTANKTSTDGEKESSFSISSLFSRLFLFHSTSITTVENSLTPVHYARSFFNRKIFSAINNCFDLETKKPVLCILLRTVKLFVANVSWLNNRASASFRSFVSETLNNNTFILLTMLKTRVLLFPNDNRIGPPKIPPSPSEFIELKQSSSHALYNVCRSVHLEGLLGLNEEDCFALIEAFTYDRQMNKFMLQRLIDYLLTSLPVIPNPAGTV